MASKLQKIVPIVSGVKAVQGPMSIVFESGKGKLEVPVLAGIKAELKENELHLSIESPVKQFKANLGTMRALIGNALKGLTDGFSKNLEIEGIGFKAAKEGNVLVLNLGFSHPIRYTPPETIKIDVEKNKIKVSGVDKAVVGQVAAEIRAFKKPEPYKGKGIKYEGEIIRRKAGKKVAAAA